ncbi:MAG: hypothetical protein V3U63_10850 [Gemmatimonadota bacterium]
MSILPFPDPATERERDEARQNPDRETLELAAQGAAKVLGADHGVTTAFAKAAETMDAADLWWARLALRTLRQGQREAIAEAVECCRHHQHGAPVCRRRDFIARNRTAR